MTEPLYIYEPTTTIKNGALHCICFTINKLYIANSDGSIFSIDKPRGNETYMGKFTIRPRHICAVGDRLWIICRFTSMAVLDLKRKEVTTVFEMKKNFDSLLYFNGYIIPKSSHQVINEKTLQIQTISRWRSGEYDCCTQLCIIVWKNYCCIAYQDGRICLFSDILEQPDKVIPEDKLQPLCAICDIGDFLYALYKDGKIYRFNGRLEKTLFLPASAIRGILTQIQSIHGYLCIHNEHYIHLHDAHSGLQTHIYSNKRRQILGEIGGCMVSWSKRLEYSVWQPLAWGKESHRNFPIRIRNAVKIFMEIGRTYKLAGRFIPTDILLIICSYIASSDTLNSAKNVKNKLARTC